MPPTRRRPGLLLAAPVAALALAAAGCGGDSASATEEWASSFCTSIATWSAALERVGNTFRDAGALSAESIGTALDDVTEATKTFADEVRGFGPPGTDSGEEIEAELETLADDLGEDVDALQAILDEDAASVDAALRNVSKVTDILAEMSAAIGSTFQALAELDAGGELTDALENAESCNTLTSRS